MAEGTWKRYMIGFDDKKCKTKARGKGCPPQDDLSALVKQLYDQSCAVFGEKFFMEYAVKKTDMEIHNLEMETSESHGTFKIPKLKKVNKFKMVGEEEAK